MPPAGPRITFFPKGATPDLPDSVAAKLIGDGIAEACDSDIRIVPTSEIIDQLKASV